MAGASISIDLRGTIALVTGAASGIGLACAQLLAVNGASVAFADRNRAGLDAALAATPGEHLAVDVDVAQSSSVQAMTDRVLERFGHIDSLVHCAAISPRRTVVEMTDEEWHQTIAVNLDGTMYTARAVARSMLAHGSGTMLFITSDNGLYGQGAKSAYAASKGGQIAFVKSLAIELAPRGITVNALNPGTTDTPMLRAEMPPEVRERRIKSDPLGRLSEPSEIAEIVLFLSGAAARYMTGQVITTRMRGL
jgi:NAD(P)-dependent dehydrogenase (short-subunit alcohol dehydrogenase family)